jgi:urease accessory protein
MSDAMLPLMRLLQLASPALPVGGYSYSQGLESAVEAGTVRDAASARTWIGDSLALSMALSEAPVWCRLYCAWQQLDGNAVGYWNDFFLASRESCELRAETVQMGFSLAKLLTDAEFVDSARLEVLHALEEQSFPTSFACAAAAMHIEKPAGLAAYSWAWLENQVMAAIKLVPLGQLSGQRILHELAASIPNVVSRAASMHDDDICNFAPGLAIASSRHETQYARLFRS